MNHEKSGSAETDSLVESVRRGDEQALELLFSSHRAYLRQVIEIRIDDVLRTRVDPSDIVQEAHMEALRRVEEYIREPKLPVRLWMRQIAVDRLAMAHRKHVLAAKRTVRREFALPQQSSISIAQRLLTKPLSSQISKSETAAQVRSAVAGLDELDREIVLLQAFEGLNSTESAQVLGIEPATARKRFGRALLRLRQLLVDSGVGDRSDD